MVKCGLLKLKLYIDLLTGAIKSLNIPLLGVNLTPLQDNAWLSGLIDADGSFYLNWLYDKSKLPTSLQYYLRISQRKTSHDLSAAHRGIRWRGSLQVAGVMIPFWEEVIAPVE